MANVKDAIGEAVKLAEQIKTLDKSIEDVLAGRKSHDERISASREALTQALREYAITPNTETQSRVDSARELEADGLKAKHTGGDALSVLQGDRKELKDQYADIMGKIERERKQAKSTILLERKTEVIEAIGPLLVEWLAILEYAEGVPCGITDISSMVRKAYPKLKDDARELSGDWRRADKEIV